MTAGANLVRLVSQSGHGTTVSNGGPLWLPVACSESDVYLSAVLADMPRRAADAQLNKGFDRAIFVELRSQNAHKVETTSQFASASGLRNHTHVHGLTQVRIRKLSLGGNDAHSVTPRPPPESPTPIQGKTALDFLASASSSFKSPQSGTKVPAHPRARNTLTSCYAFGSVVATSLLHTISRLRRLYTRSTRGPPRYVDTYSCSTFKVYSCACMFANSLSYQMMTV